jgi:hypothetical protein
MRCKRGLTEGAATLTVDRGAVGSADRLSAVPPAGGRTNEQTGSMVPL